jgi:large subunit ribosomal protein L30
MTGSGRFRLTQVRSRHGRLKSHQATLTGLGLRRIHQSVVVADTPEIRGMINRVSYMLKIEELPAD